MEKKEINYHPNHRIITKQEQKLFKERREQMGISRQAMQERFGLCQNYISRMENKGGNFPMWLLDKLTQIYKIKEKDLSLL